MNFHTVLDISAVIWDEIDYDDNKYHYFQLANSLLTLIDKLETFKPKILMRKELLDEIIINFPYGRAYDLEIDLFEYQTIQFLNNISNVILYPDTAITDLISIPDLVKPHYNGTTINEINYLISKIHTDNETDNVYFTFQYLWNDNEDKLKTRLDENLKEYETIICDDKTQLNDFFDKSRPIFEHNPKHDKTPYNDKEAWEKSDNKGDFISRLSCYNGVDNDKPQELLDSAVKYEGIYINYDGEHETWVIFRCHLDNKYHGYDEYDSNQIPEEIKKCFNK